MNIRSFDGWVDELPGTLSAYSPGLAVNAADDWTLEAMTPAMLASLAVADGLGALVAHSQAVNAAADGWVSEYTHPDTELGAAELICNGATGWIGA